MGENPAGRLVFNLLSTLAEDSLAEEPAKIPREIPWSDGSTPSVAAWLPFTGRGVSAFAEASFTRTLAFHLLFVVSAATLAGWSVYRTWLPSFNQAVNRLPESAAHIRNGRFTWPDTESSVLGETPQFGIAVNPTGQSAPSQEADFQLEFYPRDLRLHGLTGYLIFPYPPELSIPLDRVGGTSAWQAWNWVLGTGSITFLFLVLWLSGGLAATLLMLPLWSVGFVVGRRLSLSGAWRLILISWVPGSLLWDVGFWGYSWNWVRLTGILSCGLGHAFLWIAFIVWALMSCPTRDVPKPVNPFRTDLP